MFKIAICDDQIGFLSEMKELLSRWPNLPKSTLISSFLDGDSLIAAHTENPFDILLLDVVMPLSNGIEVAREIREFDRTVHLVFLTTSPEYAVDSYTVKADNYLLKPIDSGALYRCLEELLSDIQKKAKTITVRSNYASHRLALQDIEYVEAQNKHTIFSLADGRRIESIDSLHSLEQSFLLTDGFFRCHRSYIVHFDHIDLFTQKEIKLRSGATIPLARSCQKEFQTAYFTDVFRKAGENRD